MAIKYKRVLIKISGEALAGDDRFGVNDAQLEKTAKQIKEIHDAGVEVGIVEFRAFYYLCKVKLQHAAKISCGIWESPKGLYFFLG